MSEVSDARRLVDLAEDRAAADQRIAAEKRETEDRLAAERKEWK
jgi:hypothetical protein